MKKTALIALVLCLTSAAPAATSVTMGDFVTSVRQAAVVADFENVDSMLNERLQESLDLIEDSGVTGLTLEEFAKAPERPDLLMLGHGNREVFAYGLAAEMDTVGLQWAVRQVRGMSENELDDALKEALTASMGDPTAAREAADSLLRPVTVLQREMWLESLAQNLGKLRRYEQKFGPRSPRLNGVEAVANYFAQIVPWFGPDENGWPGPLEIVASYDTAYLTVADRQPDLVSTAGFGIRCYLFADGWGEADGLVGMLKPAYFSLGALFAPEEDGALLWPWDGGEPRVGGFVTWGEVKLAYVGGDDARFMVSREFQAIPWLF